MERQLWKAVLQVMDAVDKPRHIPLCKSSAIRIVEVWFWAVIHDRPVSWAKD